jgi:hypothetical protein
VSQHRGPDSRPMLGLRRFIFLDRGTLSARGSADLTPMQVSPFSGRPHYITLLGTTTRGIPTCPADSRHASASDQARRQVPAGLGEDEEGRAVDQL